MKRSFPAAYVPLPIFSQKKRNRQPLTSVPEKNEGFGFVAESSDLDSMWPNRTYQEINSAKKVEYSDRPYAHPHPMPNSYFNQQYKPSAPAKSSFWFGDGNALQTKDLNCYPKRQYEQMQMAESSKGQVYNHNYASQVHSTQHLSKQISASSLKRSENSFSVSSGSKNIKPPYTFKSYKKKNDDVFDDMPEEEMVQVLPLYQISLKEKHKTLRVITASIESMKRWSQYTDQAPLLFELLAMLDSAVTSGNHGSKIFILRDGKDPLSCVFYEIDRDLPKLIRGRVLRVMGNYDQERNLLKCVSVRPASPAEQQTFPEFVTAASNEMEQFIKTINKN